MKVLDCPIADTEYHYDVPAGTRKFTIYLLGAEITDVLKYYWAPASADYGELYGSEALSEDFVLLTGRTLYFKVSVAGKKVHVTTWQ
jgi:hypothetical protein